MTINIKRLILFIFAVRPIIDLAWKNDILLGMNLAGIISIVIIVLSCLQVMLQGMIKIDSVVKSGVLMIFLSGISTLLNISSFTDFDFTLRLLSALCFYIVVVPGLTKDEFERCIGYFVVATIIPIGLTYLQVAGVVEYTYFDYINGTKVLRGSGGYHQPSVLTRFCIFGLVYVYYLLESRWGKSTRKKRMAYIYIVLNIIAVLLSYHRTGYLLLAIITAYWFYLQNKRNMSKYWGKMIIAVVAVVFLFFIMYFSGVFSLDFSMFERLLSLDNIFVINDGKFQLVLRGRGHLINLLVQGFYENPWYNTLLGNGVYINSVSGINMQVADMDFIRMIWNIGIIGFCIWMYHIYILKIKITKGIRDSALQRLAKCIFWMYIIWGFTLEATSTPNIMSQVYLVCGFVSKQLCRESEGHNESGVHVIHYNTKL